MTGFDVDPDADTDAELPERETAELVETDDGYEMLPPTVSREGAPRADVYEAVVDAVEAEPNAVDGPVVYDAEQAPRDRVEVGALTCRLNELPDASQAIEGAERVEFMPLYRTEERLLSALRDALPDDVRVEVERRGVYGFYEVSH